MDLSQIILILGAVGGGGAIGAVAQVYLGRLNSTMTVRKGDQDFIREGFELAVKVITDQRDDALKANEEMRRRLDNTELEIVGLKLSSSFDPFPRWMVDLEGRYLFVNPCFEERFLEPMSMSRRDIVGKGHEVLWPPEVCEKIKHLNQMARSRPDGRARAVVNLDGMGEVSLFKFPVRVHGVIVAYAGYIMEHV
jgi:hypothetical protein